MSPPRGGVSVRFGTSAARAPRFAASGSAWSPSRRGLHARAVRVARRWAESAPARVFGRDQPETHLKYFAALGRVAAVALYHGETLPLRLTDAFLDRAVLGARASLEDLKSVDPTLYANKVRYLMALAGSADTAAPTRETGFRETADVSLDATLRALDLEWSDAADPTGVFFPGETRAFTLLPTSLGGFIRACVVPGHRGDARDVPSARSSRTGRTAASRANRRVRRGLRRGGPPPLRARMRSVLRGAELSSLVAGEPGAVDAADWRRNTGHADAPLAVSFSTRCFWHALERVLDGRRARGRAAVRHGALRGARGGFPLTLVGYAGDAAPFTVAELASDARDAPRALPMAHACFNTIRLPRLDERAFGGSVEAGGEEMARRLLPPPRSARAASTTFDSAFFFT